MYRADRDRPETAMPRLAVLLAASVVAAPAAAQTQRAEPDVIVVTATRAPEARAALASPVAVMGEAELERLGAHHAAEALNRLPGVNIHRGNGVEHLTAIRSPVLTGGAGAGSFLYLEDGIPLRAAGFSNINGLFEAVDSLASRIEVVRGPGSAVYGSNALHGLVNVISRDPEDAGGVIELEAGSFGRTRAKAWTAGETRLGDGFIGLSTRREDGWRDDASLRRYALQTRLDGEAGALEWSLRGALVDVDQETATFVRGFKAYEDEAASRENADPEAFRNARAARASVHLERRFGDWTARGVLYARDNDMAFRLHFLPSLALEETGHHSLGAQSAFVREFDRGSITLGFDLDATRGYLVEDQTRPTFGSFPQGLHYDYTIDALTPAAFVQGRYDLTERLTIEAGARLERTRYDYDTRIAPGSEGRFLRPADREDDYTTFAPHLGFVFEATDSQTVFGRVARGVRAPQTAELYRLQPGQVIEGIEPEELDSVELGWRGSAGFASFELVAFAMEKRNVFFRDADGFNVTDGKTRHHGLEAEVEAALSPSLTLLVSGTLADHDYAFDRAVSRGSEVIRSGAQVDTAPQTLANARLLWTPSPAFTAEAELMHVGEYFADAANTAEYEGHDIANLRARWRFAEGAEVFAAVRNVFDTRYAERADFAFGSYRYFPGEPRAASVGVRLSR